MEPHRPAQSLNRPALRRAGIVALIVTIMATVTLIKLPLCPLATFAHIPCPGCGMTRATLAALQGNIVESLRIHPLAIILVPLLGAYAAAHAVSYVRHGVSRVDQVVTGKWVDRLLIALLIAMLGVWIARFFGAFGGPVPV